MKISIVIVIISSIIIIILMIMTIIISIVIIIDCAPELATVGIHGEILTEDPLDNSSEYPWQSSGKCHRTNQNPLENVTEHPLENATENPRCFPRCGSLVCNVLPLRGLPSARRGGFARGVRVATAALYLHLSLSLYIYIYIYM